MLGKLWLEQGRFSVIIGDGERAAQDLQAALKIFRVLGERREEAYALCYLGGSEDLYGSANAGPCKDALTLFKEIGDPRGTALALRGLAWATLHGTDYYGARQKFHESLSIFRSLADQFGMIWTLAGLGYVMWIIGQYHEAEQTHLEMLDLCQEAADRGGTARALALLAMDAFVLKAYGRSCNLVQDSLGLFSRIGNTWGVADELGCLAVAQIALHDYAQAVVNVQECLKMYPRRFLLFGQSRYYGVMAHALAELGDLRTARQYCRMSLEAARSAGLPARSLFTLVFVARISLLQGRAVEAAELLSLVLSHPATWALAKDQASEVMAGVADALPPDCLSGALARGRARDLEATVTELLAELGET